MLLLVTLLACQSDKAALDSAADGEDTGPALVGTWTGPVAVVPEGQGPQMCAGNGTVVVDASLALGGEGDCPITEGPGAGITLELAWSGSVAADDTISGTTTLAPDDGSQLANTMDMEGSVDDDGLVLQWRFEVPNPKQPEQMDSMEGTFSGTR